MKRGEKSTYIILSIIGLYNISLGIVISSWCNMVCYGERHATK